MATDYGQQVAAIEEASHDAIICDTLDGTITRWSPAAERVFGYTHGEIVGRSMMVLVPTDRAPEDAARRARIASGGRYESPETLRVAKGGRSIDVAMTCAPLRDPSDLVVGAVTVVRDLTGQQQLVRELEERTANLAVADRMRSVGALAANVAHEINNPLAFIAANLEMIGVELDGSDVRWNEIEVMTREARGGVERIHKIIRLLSRFARGEGDERRPVELESVLELAISLIAGSLGQRAHVVRHFAPVPSVRANEARLAHAFSNLLTNAAQSILAGGSGPGEVVVTTRVDTAGWAVVEIRDTGAGIPSAAVDRAKITVEVLDSGPGVPVELRDKVFEPFFTTKAPGRGTGLGLSVARAIVHRHGGMLEIRDGEGTTRFTIELPDSMPSTAANAV